MEKVKNLVFFAGKVVLALAVLNFITTATLKVSVFGLISDPMGTLSARFGGSNG